MVDTQYVTIVVVYDEDVTANVTDTAIFFNHK
jgi:hypothetical protein